MSRAICRSLLRGGLSTFAFDIYLSLKGAQNTIYEPTVKTTPDEAVLCSVTEIEQAVVELRECGLHLHPTPAKNWDHLFALKAILRESKPSNLIL